MTINSHIKRNYKSKHPLYSVFRNIKNRCNLPNIPVYKHYGGRGIKCLWNSFEEFRDDMFESYFKHCKQFGKENTSIDRINNNGNYCKENCRWATQTEQILNRRPPIHIRKGRFKVGYYQL